MAYMEYAALNAPMDSPKISVRGILKRTPIIFTTKLLIEMTKASLKKLWFCFVLLSILNYPAFKLTIENFGYFSPKGRKISGYSIYIKLFQFISIHINLCQFISIKLFQIISIISIYINLL